MTDPLKNFRKKIINDKIITISNNGSLMGVDGKIYSQKCIIISVMCILRYIERFERAHNINISGSKYVKNAHLYSIDQINAIMIENKQYWPNFEFSQFDRENISVDLYFSRLCDLFNIRVGIFYINDSKIKKGDKYLGILQKENIYGPINVPEHRHCSLVNYNGSHFEPLILETSFSRQLNENYFSSQNHNNSRYNSPSTYHHPQSIHPQSIHPQSIHPQSIHPQSIHPQSIHPQSVHQTKQRINMPICHNHISSQISNSQSIHQIMQKNQRIKMHICQNHAPDQTIIPGKRIDNYHNQVSTSHHVDVHKFDGNYRNTTQGHNCSNNTRKYNNQVIVQKINREIDEIYKEYSMKCSMIHNSDSEINRAIIESLASKMRKDISDKCREKSKYI
jgi:hypothetical protein